MSFDTWKLGPFVKGLNTYSDPTAIDDLELAEVVNFDLDIQGALVSRPPIHALAATMTVAAGFSMQLLGYYVSTAGATFLLGSDGNTSTYYYNGSAWVLITNTFAAVASAQYRDKAWLVASPTSANPGGKWDNVAGFTAVPTMPKGRCIAVQRERLWIGPGKNVSSNGSRIYFCATANPDSWPGDFISINTGDGQNVLDILVYFQDLIIFKNNSTYRFSFDLDPALGTISRVSDTVGVLDTGCAVSFRNRVMVLHDNNLFELSNYNYEQVNDKVPFEQSSVVATYFENASLSFFSDRVFVSFYGNLYVWSVITRTWSTWESMTLTTIGRMLPLPNDQAIDAEAYTYSTVIGANTLYRVIDAVTSDTETMHCKIRTKNYDYQDASVFKRIAYWGVDCIARDTVVGTMTPIVYSNTITWGAAKLRTWGDALAFTWGRPIEPLTTTADTVPIQGITGERKFIKLGTESRRFRQINFAVDILTDGSASKAPVHIFNLLTRVKTKQTVSKRIS